MQFNDKFLALARSDARQAGISLRFLVLDPEAAAARQRSVDLDMDEATYVARKIVDCISDLRADQADRA